ncbi:hypothetical protein [Caulobacter endophyticus]|uniref:hypothetical protein n=1 Tax=Caulobacter endophyticus TaxID=2172652 RepID=UPI0011B2615C|nr:hypothetical protein [Caulobacter endophyticus]
MKLLISIISLGIWWIGAFLALYAVNVIFDRFGAPLPLEVILVGLFVGAVWYGQGKFVTAVINVLKLG